MDKIIKAVEQNSEKQSHYLIIDPENRVNTGSGNTVQKKPEEVKSRNINSFMELPLYIKTCFTNTMYRYRGLLTKSNVRVTFSFISKASKIFPSAIVFILLFPITGCNKPNKGPSIYAQLDDGTFLTQNDNLVRPAKSELPMGWGGTDTDSRIIQALENSEDVTNSDEDPDESTFKKTITLIVPDAGVTQGFEYSLIGNDGDFSTFVFSVTGCDECSPIPELPASIEVEYNTTKLNDGDVFIHPANESVYELIVRSRGEKLALVDVDLGGVVVNDNGPKDLNAQEDIIEFIFEGKMLAYDEEHNVLFVSQFLKQVRLML